jgi:hypothetical protein
VVPGHNVIIDLDTTTVNAPMQALSEHNRDACVGVIDTATKTNKLVVSGRLFSDIAGSQGEKIALLAQRGVPYQISVGLYHYAEEYIGRGQSVTVNGKTVEGPVTVLRNGRVRECSIVTLGADSDAKARLFGHGRHDRLPDARDIYRKHNAADKF